MSALWRLDQDPRQYRVSRDDGGKWSQNIGRRRIVGVTSVLGDKSDFLSTWAAGQAYLAATKFGAPYDVAERAYEAGVGPEAIRDAGGRRGTAAHLVFAALCRGEQPPADFVTPLTWPYVMGLERAVEELGLCGGDSEVAVGSLKHAFAGTFDYFQNTSRWPNMLLGPCLYDVKTGTPSWTHALQLAAYEVARREMGMEHARHFVVIYPTPYGTYYTITVKQLGGYAAARRGWLQTLALHRQKAAIDRLILKHRGN